jgi:hypothetical protein
LIYKKDDIVTIFDPYTNEEIRVAIQLPIQIGFKQLYRVMRIDVIGEKENRPFIINDDEIVTHLLVN